MPAGIQWKRTHCSRMDHGGCGLLAGVRGNRIIEIKGDPEGFLNKGYACPKGLASAERLTHPGRLLHPMKRKGRREQGGWERITWSEAIQFIAGRLNDIKKAAGAKAVAFCQGMPKVVDPPQECWPALKILNELGKAVTPREHWHEDWEALLEDVLKPSGLSYDQFAERGYLRGPERFRKYLSGGFKTATGKAELSLSQAEKFGLSPLPQFTGFPDEEHPDYPLVLTSCKSRFYLHSSYRWLESLRKHRPHPKTEIHPETAARYGIADGNEILIETKAGAITQVAHVTDRIHPRVVNAAYGWWFAEAGVESLYGWDKSNFNILTTTERLGKAFGTPNLKGIGCRIRRKLN